MYIVSFPGLNSTIQVQISQQLFLIRFLGIGSWGYIEPLTYPNMEIVVIFIHSPNIFSGVTNEGLLLAFWPLIGTGR